MIKEKTKSKTQEQATAKAALRFLLFQIDNFKFGKIPYYGKKIIGKPQRENLLHQRGVKE